MEKLSNELINFDYSNKRQRGKLLANITRKTLSDLGKNYRLPKGYKTEFSTFTPNANVNAFGDDKTKKLFFSFNLFNSEDNIAKDIYTVAKEIRMLTEYKGKYDNNNPVDKQSTTFVSTGDLTTMITIEKSGNAGKTINQVEEKKSKLFEQIKKDVEMYMMAKNFLSPKEKQSRKFAMDFLKSMLDSLSPDASQEEIARLMDKIKNFIDEKEKEEKEKEEKYSQFINNVERDMIQTIQVAQTRLSEDVASFGGLSSMAQNFKTVYGYDAIKVGTQSLAINYDDKLAKNLFNACVIMDGDKHSNLTNCLNLIKYTDFVPTKLQVHNLNEASRNYNATCSNSADKVHPKKDLKNFFNVKTKKHASESTSTYQQVQEM